jgi:hypothetical protein
VHGKARPEGLTNLCLLRCLALAWIRDQGLQKNIDRISFALDFSSLYDRKLACRVGAYAGTDGALIVDHNGEPAAQTFGDMTLIDLFQRG